MLLTGFRCRQCGTWMRFPKLTYDYYMNDRPEREHWLCPECGAEIATFDDREDHECIEEDIE